MHGRALAILLLLAAETSAFGHPSARKSLPRRGGCFRRPVRIPGWWLTSPFHDLHYPFADVIGPHVGIDLQMPAGTPVFAPAPGRVTWAGPDKEGTHIVAVRVRGKWTYRFLHLRMYAVRRGARVRRGQLLGRSGGEVGADGSGPYTTGAHLHFDLLDRHDRFIDPEPYFCAAPPRMRP